MRLRAMISATLGLAAGLSLASPAAAQFQDILDGIGFGRDKEAIEFRERAPLVVPPTLNLRPPEQRGVALREPKWPNDPDVARKRAADIENRRPVLPDSLRENGDRPRILSVEELRQGRVAGAELANGPNNTRNHNGYDADQDGNGRLNPDVLRAQGEAFRGTREPPLKPGEEPKRKYLTDPPTGLRAAAAGAPLTASAEPREDRDGESSPYAFFRRITGLDE